MADKAAVFIDGGYFAKVRTQLGFDTRNLDYCRLSDNLCVGCERFRTYYYDCMPYRSAVPSLQEQTRYQDKQRFISSLRNLPRFEIRLGHLLRLGTEFKQKGVDILLSIDLTRLSWQGKIDKAILVTGDTDFIPAIQEAKDASVITTLAYCPNMPSRISPALYEVCDERFQIDALFLQNCAA